ncbi:MAG: GTPase HflX [Thermoanaerobaculia bacterium]|nr:GTPase HflX [Thermoanaerobaculia bacterium]
MDSNHKTLVSGRRVFLVGLALPSQPPHVVEEHLDELADLAVSAGAAVAGRSLQSRKAPHAATFIGPGKAASLKRACAETGAELLIFDDDLSPSQVAKLEEATDRAVLDRSGLILEIFRAQARSREARTQVELAQLEYQLPRLTRRWTHLSRQAGGIGLRGGEGETQLEVDRRQLRQRIRRLKKDLEKIEQTRSVQRSGRRHMSTVALAGYTNAGKSTLFNQLTNADARVEDRVFATLDSKLRRGALSYDHIVLFADTVGFIRKLPHHLVASFRGTLEEVVDADVVVHVVDRSHPAWEEQRRVGGEVLEDLGIEEERILEVHNKVDRLSSDPVAADHLLVSAETGRGIDELKARIAERLGRPRRRHEGGYARLDSGWPST